jgi:hypothetical protein
MSSNQDVKTYIHSQVFSLNEKTGAAQSFTGLQAAPGIFGFDAEGCHTVSIKHFKEEKKLSSV